MEFFFPEIMLECWGCGLYTSAAYTRVLTVHSENLQLRVLKERSVSKGGNLCPLRLEILHSFWYSDGDTLRPGDCKYRELIFKTEITGFFIFCQEKPFGKLFSKIRLKLVREFFIQQIQQKVELRFSGCGHNKFSRKLRHIHITLGEIRLGQLK